MVTCQPRPRLHTLRPSSLHAFKPLCPFKPSSSFTPYNLLAMVHVTLENDRAVFVVEGTHQLWALRSRLDIPLTHITDVEFDPSQVGRWWHGWKLMGADVPGLFAAGT